MKKLLFTLFAALLTLNVVADNPKGQCGQNLSWEFDAKNYTLTIKGYGPMENYTDQNTPWHTTEYDFTDFGKVFINTFIKKVIFPDGITTIGNYAFKDCSLIGEIELPNSITEIGEYAFYNCRNLKISSTPENLKSIGNNAFYNCSKMQDTDGSIYFGTTLFQNKSATEIELKKGTTEIAKGAFKNNINLEKITFSDNSLKTIGDEAFSGCTDLVTCNIPSSVENWGKKIFEGCSSLQTTTRDGFTYQMAGQHVIVKVAYTSKKYITIPENVKFIEGGALNDSFDQKAGLDYLIYKPEDAPKLGGELCDNTHYNAIKTTVVPSSAISNYQAGAYGPNINTTTLTNLSSKKYTSCTFLHNAIVPIDVAVYKASANGESVTLTKVNNENDGNFVIQKGEGVFLKTLDEKTGRVYEFKNAEQAEDLDGNFDGNILKGVTEDMTLTSNHNAWVMQTKDNVQGFYRVGENGINIKIGKAYLEYENSSARVLSIFDESATAIEEIDEDYASNNATIYNVNGQKLTAPQKGVNIINGKIIIK